MRGAREIVLVMVLQAALMTGCASNFGEGEVYGATYPASPASETGAAAAQSSPRSPGVYGFDYPRSPRSDAHVAAGADVATPTETPRAKTVYGFEYPRSE